jgi:hypothetical protein
MFLSISSAWSLEQQQTEFSNDDVSTLQIANTIVAFIYLDFICHA